MTTTSVQEIAGQFPAEISLAVDGLSGETERAVFILLFNEEDMAFTELREKLGDEEPLHPTTLTNALDSLKQGGLIRQRILEDTEEKPFSSYYELTEYGSRFINALFKSLGAVNSPTTPSLDPDMDDPADIIDNSDLTESKESLFGSPPEAPINAK